MEVIEAYIETNEFSRPGRLRRETLGIVMHYLGVSGQTAMQARNYFDSLKKQNGKDNIPDRSASAHDIIDLDGTIYAAVPKEEKAYHCGSSQIDPVSKKVYTDLARQRLGDYAWYPDKTSPNSCLVGIEMCHRENGFFNTATIVAAAERCAYYCKLYRLDPLTQIFTHNEIVGWKKCPEYWVKFPMLFEAFKKDVARIIGA